VEVDFTKFVLSMRATISMLSKHWFALQQGLLALPGNSMSRCHRCSDQDRMSSTTGALQIDQRFPYSVQKGGLLLDIPGISIARLGVEASNRNPSTLCNGSAYHLMEQGQTSKSNHSRKTPSM
jgi:hypothetical protein